MIGICRLCATIRKENLLNVIKDDEDDICKKLLECCRLEIRVEDKLPKTVCSACLQTLQIAHEFHRKVHESEESLQELLSKENSNSFNSNLQSNTDNYAKLLFVGEVAAEDKQKKQEVVEEDKEEVTQNDYSVEYLNDLIEDDVNTYEKIETIHHVAYSVSNTNCDENAPEDIEVLEENSDEEDEKGESGKEHFDDNCSLLDEHVEDETNNKLSSITLHVKQVKDWSDLEWMCNICAEYLTNYGELIKHGEKEHQVKASEIVLRCTNCHKRCTRYLNFLNHVRFQHHANLALCCDICNKQCVDFETLAVHRNICDRRKKFNSLVMCPKCGKSFSNFNAQYFHDRMQHSSLEKTFDCQQCGKKFKRLFTLRTHERVHSSAKDFSCEICGRAFRQKINMETHMHAHSEDKDYECAICKKSFKTAASLNKHGLTHTDIRDFKCQYCEKEFRTNDAKISHERIHTGEMPYKCEYCKKSFRFRSTFSSHLNLHTGERPYSCVECNHHFTNWSNYNKHMKRRHNDRSLKKTKTTATRSQNDTYKVTHYL